MSRGKSEETRGRILAAAGQLFAEKGYAAVTMREIARAAGCSHTAIYLYFKDKEALLHHLALPPLRHVTERLRDTLGDGRLTPEQKLRDMCRTFVRLSFQYRSLYAILFLAGAGRVDDPAPKNDVHRQRNEVFALLRRGLTDCLPPLRDEAQGLAYGRMLFFLLHGIVASYVHGEEPTERVLERLQPTFDAAIDVLLAGIRQRETGP